MDFVPADLDWLREAKCAGMPTNLFINDGGPLPEWVKATCDGCPVRVECREFAIRSRSMGWWGGSGEGERRAEIRRRRRDGLL